GTGAGVHHRQPGAFAQAQGGGGGCRDRRAVAPAQAAWLRRNAGFPVQQAGRVRPFRSQLPAPRWTRGPESGGPGPGGGLTGRVLLIENDVPSMELMFHLLTTYGYFPQRARSGEEGLKLAARERPDLIVSDIQMPNVDGYEVARRIRADPGLSSIPMIAVSSFNTV